MAYREKYYQETNNTLFEDYTREDILADGGVIAAETGGFFFDYYHRNADSRRTDSRRGF